jgi:hypothetical protein
VTSDKMAATIEGPVFLAFLQRRILGQLSTHASIVGRVDRRTFLKRGAIGAGVLLLGGVGLAAFPSGDLAAPTRALAVLTPRAFGVLAAIAKRVVTVEGADAVTITHGVDDALRHANAQTQGDIVALLMLFESALAGAIFDARVMPFTRLSPEKQDAVLDAWRRSRVDIRRTGYSALKQMCVAAHYITLENCSSFGYPPPLPYPVVSDDSKFGAGS